MERRIKIIAHIHTDFPTKFGIPRQSGLVENEAIIVFEPEYRNEDALRGILGFSHLWLIWEFSKAVKEDWSPTVRPPRLGGNEKMGVFATRSPFRPNPIGLSSVRLLGTEQTSKGTDLRVSGADLMDGTPIYDIKPYLAYTDAHPDAVGGFTDGKTDNAITVEVPPVLLTKLPEEKRAPLIAVLEQDPRPRYLNDPNRVYGFPFAGFEIRFSVREHTLTVLEVEPI